MEIAGTTYTVKFTLGTLRRMKKAGVDLGNLAEAFKDIDNICLAATMSFGTEQDGKWLPIPYTPDEFADLIPMHRFRELSEALWGAAAKVLPATDPAQVPPAAPNKPNGAIN
jgi:hypothetical protein